MNDDDDIRLIANARFPDPETVARFVLMAHRFERENPGSTIDMMVDPRAQTLKSVIAERDAWLARFDKRKAELIAGGMAAELADEAALAEIRAAIRQSGFRPPPSSQH